jgi:hypothetical protein
MRIKKGIVENIKKGLLVSIGGLDIDFPIDPNWDSPEDVLNTGNDIITEIIIFASVIAVAMIVVSGYTLITAAGDPEKIQKGQKTLTAAIVGFIIVTLVVLIIRFVLSSSGAIGVDK